MAAAGSRVLRRGWWWQTVEEKQTVPVMTCGEASALPSCFIDYKEKTLKTFVFLLTSDTRCWSHDFSISVRVAVSATARARPHIVVFVRLAVV